MAAPTFDSEGIRNISRIILLFYGMYRFYGKYYISKYHIRVYCIKVVFIDSVLEPINPPIHCSQKSEFFFKFSLKDFGLSNTIYSPDSTNENHCSTQCGSPAYAAPELLVRKDYGPQIDVWSM